MNIINIKIKRYCDEKNCFRAYYETKEWAKGTEALPLKKLFDSIYFDLKKELIKR